MSINTTNHGTSVSRCEPSDSRSTGVVAVVTAALLMVSGTLVTTAPLSGCAALVGGAAGGAAGYAAGHHAGEEEAEEELAGEDD